MDILRKYKNFINEAVDSDKEIKTMADVPNEIMETARKIAGDMFDRVKKPTFDFINGKGLVMTFNVTEQDFYYIEPNEILELDMTEGAKRKRTYDVTLKYLDRSTETFEVKYLVIFEMFEFEADDDDLEDNDDDDYDDIEDIDFQGDDDEMISRYDMLLKNWKLNQAKNKLNIEPGEGTRKRLMNQAKKEVMDEDYFDEDEAHMNILKGKYKIDDIDVQNLEIDDDDEDE